MELCHVGTAPFFVKKFMAFYVFEMFDKVVFH